jgi:hypothetical protein
MRHKRSVGQLINSCIEEAQRLHASRRLQWDVVLYQRAKTASRPNGENRPSGKTASEDVQPVCPLSVRAQEPLRTSHTYTVLSWLPLARWPSGRTASERVSRRDESLAPRLQWQFYGWQLPRRRHKGIIACSSATQRRQLFGVQSAASRRSVREAWDFQRWEATLQTTHIGASTQGTWDASPWRCELPPRTSLLLLTVVVATSCDVGEPPTCTLHIQARPKSSRVHAQ